MTSDIYNSTMAWYRNPRISTDDFIFFYFNLERNIYSLCYMLNYLTFCYTLEVIMENEKLEKKLKWKNMENKKTGKLQDLKKIRRV